MASGVAAGTMSATALTAGVGALFGPLGILAFLGVGAIIGEKLKKWKNTLKH